MEPSVHHVLAQIATGNLTIQRGRDENFNEIVQIIDAL